MIKLSGYNQIYIIVFAAFVHNRVNRNLLRMDVITELDASHMQVVPTTSCAPEIHSSGIPPSLFRGTGLRV
jgi:hypothetical protein